MIRNRNERKSPSSLSLDCDVGLGLKMQVQPTTTETETETETSYSSSCCKRPTILPLYHQYHHQQQQQQFVSSENVTGFTCDGGGGGSFLNQVAAGGGDGIYESSLHTSHSSGFYRPSGGGVHDLFSASQLQELERQKMIHKYMMASLPVPPQLLILPISTTTTTSFLAPIISQSNKSLGGGQDLRFTSSSSLSSSTSCGVSLSDPEPWRCKRTDGKKWRCSRDVAAPQHKYCERHAHKTRTTRSRKPVEHNLLYNTTTTTSTPLQTPTCLPFPTMDNNQSRCNEWFIRGGSSSNEQKQHQLPSSSTPHELMYKDQNKNNNVSLLLYQQPPPPHEYEEEEVDKQCFMSLINPYNTINHQIMTSSSNGGHCSSNSINFDDCRMAYAAEKTTTRHFIDAWGEDKGGDSRRKKFSPSSSSSSLTLSMSPAGTTLNWNNIDDDQDNNENEKHPWFMNNNNNNNNLMNQVSWMNSTPPRPGGPLGEALCLGNNNNNNTTRSRGSTGSLNLPSPPHGYSNNSSSSKRSSCGEDGSLSHALNFIG